MRFRGAIVNYMCSMTRRHCPEQWDGIRSKFCLFLGDAGHFFYPHIWILLKSPAAGEKKKSETIHRLWLAAESTQILSCLEQEWNPALLPDSQSFRCTCKTSSHIFTKHADMWTKKVDVQTRLSFPPHCDWTFGSAKIRLFYQSLDSLLCIPRANTLRFDTSDPKSSSTKGGW